MIILGGRKGGLSLSNQVFQSLTDTAISGTAHQHRISGELVISYCLYLMHVFHWSRPCNQPYNSRVGWESRRVVGKSAQKWWVSYEIPVISIPTRRRVGDIFCMASRRSTMTSPKPLTDKPDHKQTSNKDKQTSREHVPDPS